MTRFVDHGLKEIYSALVTQLDMNIRGTYSTNMVPHCALSSKEDKLSTRFSGNVVSISFSESMPIQLNGPYQVNQHTDRLATTHQHLEILQKAKLQSYIHDGR